MEEIDQNSVVQQPNKYKTLFFILLFLVVISVIAGGFFYLGRRQATKIKPVPSVTPTSAVDLSEEETVASPTKGASEVKDEEVVTIGPNTVSFARVGENTHLKYRGKIYDDSNQFEPHEVNLQNPNQYKWYGLADAPEGVVPNEFMSDEVFGFKVAPDTKSFAFVMRWNNEFYLFYYTPFDKYRQSILVKKFASGDPAKINQFSQDGKYLALNLYDCWNCGGHPPETALIRLSDNEMKNIGKTSYFNWLKEDKYEYKDYVEIDCVGDVMGPCSEDPDKLPLKTGQF